MSVTAVQAPASAPERAAPSAAGNANMAATLIARSSVAGVALMLLASAAPPPAPQGRQVDLQA